MEMNEKNLIDYGKYIIPKSWDELTLKTFSKIEEYYSDKDKNVDIRDVLSILCNKTQDEINALPSEFTEKILENLAWLGDKPRDYKPSNKVEINGEIYQVNTQNKLKTGEYIAVDTILKNDKHNYAAIMAILCRKEGEKYDSYYENEVLPSRIEMWEGVSVMKVLPIISFFLTCWVTLNLNSQLYGKVEEAINLTQKRIETLRKNGEISKLSTILLKRKLKKLRKSMKSI